MNIIEDVNWTIQDELINSLGFLLLANGMKVFILVSAIHEYPFLLPRRRVR